MYLILNKLIIILIKQNCNFIFGNIPDDESSLDVSSPREINSPSVSKKDVRKSKDKFLYKFF